MDFITSLLTEWGYLALFIIMALENMNIPIPSEIVLGFAGFLVFKGVFAFWPTILVGTAAGLTGSLLSYWMGYKGGRKILLKFSTKGHQKADCRRLLVSEFWRTGCIHRTFASRHSHFYFPPCRYCPVQSQKVHRIFHCRHYPLDHAAGLYRFHPGGKLGNPVII